MTKCHAGLFEQTVAALATVHGLPGVGWADSSLGPGARRGGGRGGVPATLAGSRRGGQ